MATYRAVEAAAATVVHVLQDAFDPVLVPDAEPLRFHLVGPEDLAGGLPSGVGVLVYAVEVDPTGRNLGAGLDRTGGRTPPGLTLRVRLLVLVTAEDAATRLTLAGWVLSTLPGNAVLAADLLNRVAGRKPVFRDDETVRVLVDPLEASDLLRRLEVLGGDATDVLALPYAVDGIDSSPAEGSG
jgi:hypothetical protein